MVRRRHIVLCHMSEGSYVWIALIDAPLSDHMKKVASYHPPQVPSHCFSYVIFCFVWHLLGYQFHSATLLDRCEPIRSQIGQWWWNKWTISPESSSVNHMSEFLAEACIGHEGLEEDHFLNSPQRWGGWYIKLNPWHPHPSGRSSGESPLLASICCSHYLGEMRSGEPCNILSWLSLDSFLSLEIFLSPSGSKHFSSEEALTQHSLSGFSNMFGECLYKCQSPFTHGQIQLWHNGFN